MNDLSTRIGDWIIAGLIGLVIGALGMKWWDEGHPSTITRMLAPKAPINTPVTAQVAPQLASAPIAPAKLQTCTVQTYTAPVTVRQHLLPKPVADDAKQAIVASSRVEPDDHPETITATVDTDTGQALQSVVREPLPWLAFNRKYEIAAYAGLKGTQPTGRIEARADLVQAKILHCGPEAGIDFSIPGGIPQSPFVGLGCAARF